MLPVRQSDGVRQLLLLLLLQAWPSVWTCKKELLMHVGQSDRFRQLLVLLLHLLTMTAPSVQLLLLCALCILLCAPSAHSVLQLPCLTWHHVIRWSRAASIARGQSRPRTGLATFRHSMHSVHSMHSRHNGKRVRRSRVGRIRLERLRHYGTGHIGETTRCRKHWRSRVGCLRYLQMLFSRIRRSRAGCIRGRCSLQQIEQLERT